MSETSEQFQSMHQASAESNITKSLGESQLQHDKEKADRLVQEVQETRDRYKEKYGHFPGEGKFDKTGSTSDLPAFDSAGNVVSAEEARAHNEELYRSGVEKRLDPGQIPPPRSQY